MFFVVPPFELDSLNNTDPASINFGGTFVSSGMFPSFKEKLHTQPDKSLGFEHTIPNSGYQLYNGDGKMTGDLTMNSRGLRGSGTIEYLAASVTANDFVYYPDSVLANGSRAFISEKQFGAVNFPQATLTDFDMKWFPAGPDENQKHESAIHILRRQCGNAGNGYGFEGRGWRSRETGYPRHRTYFAGHEFQR
jgi:hypothetical protein